MKWNWQTQWNVGFFSAYEHIICMKNIFLNHSNKTILPLFESVLAYFSALRKVKILLFKFKFMESCHLFLRWPSFLLTRDFATNIVQLILYHPSAVWSWTLSIKQTLQQEEPHFK